MLTALAENKGQKLLMKKAPALAASPQNTPQLLQEFKSFEAARGRDLTHEEIWAGIESDEDAYNPSDEELVLKLET